MKPIKIAGLLSTLVIALCAAPATAQHVEVKLTEKVKVLFPQQPVKQENGPASLYLLRLEDSTANFLAVVTDLQQSVGLDEGTIAVAMLESTFWDEAANGFLAQ
ncbi:MAG TPA: hypothetical protein VK907_06345, partial [Phnomibacter sp.]|nr:hypothetical protein [Phnomibacter sp.]